MLRDKTVFCLLVLLVQVCSTLVDDFLRDDFDHYVTEPSIRSYQRTIIEKVDDSSLLQPGYIFFAPFPKLERQYVGPHIVDQEGELVWWGNDTVHGRVQNFHVCNYLGSRGQHLCWSECTFPWLMEQGSNHVLDETYTPVTRAFEAAYPLSNPNPHEFFITPSGLTFVQVIYQLRPMDLTPYAGPEDGFVEDGCFQEIDFITGQAVFSWCALDHIPIWHTKIFLHVPGNVVNWTGEAYGDGTIEAPWDYFHINSVDMTNEGDYILSARHLDQVLKIAGNNKSSHNVDPGTIIWRLGGKFNDFAHPEVADLSRQHHARVINTTTTEMTLSLFNNQWQQNEDHRHLSNVQVVTVDTQKMSVISSKRWNQPEGMTSLAQGSMQILPNDNVLIGWGTIPQVSEFSPDGALLFHMHLDRQFKVELGTKNMQNYRVFKFDWHGKPKTDPKLIVYSQFCTTSPAAPLIAYISWNGATEVRYWRFYRSSFSGIGPWIPVGTFPKQGFETKVHLRDFYYFRALFAATVKVEALDASKNVLGSKIEQTFVPIAAIRNNCTVDVCFEPEWFDYSQELSCADRCGSQDFARLANVILLLAGVGIVSRCVLYKWKVSSMRHFYWSRLEN